MTASTTDMDVCDVDLFDEIADVCMGLTGIARAAIPILEVHLVFGEMIKAARMAAGLTQQKLGELCGYTGRSAEVTVQEWEHNRRPVPLDKLRVLAQALNISLDSLIP